MAPLRNHYLDDFATFFSSFDMRASLNFVACIRGFETA